MWDEGGRRKEEGEEVGGVWPRLTVALPTIPISHFGSSFFFMFVEGFFRMCFS